MYVKLYNKVLYSSLAENRRLRHFFTDMLLCSDMDGNVVMTKSKIATNIGADLEEVEWGIAELMKPDQGSLTPDHEGRRIIPLEGHGYGWKIVNYEVYRDFKNSKELRDATARRVRRWREEHKAKPRKSAKSIRAENDARERRYQEASKRGDQAECDRIAAEGLAPNGST